MPIKRRLGYADKQLITSFGFLRPGRKERSSGRGYEYVLDALPSVIKKFPNVLYLIIGVTHPKTLKLEGEKYRHFLENKVRELGLEKNVKFINKYLALKEIIELLQAADIYISSGINSEQIVSGTLSYAMGCGRAVISTPFLHARKIVSREMGLLVKFRDPGSFADAIIKLLSNPGLREKMGRSAYSGTRHMTWHNVSLSYLNVFKKIIAEHETYEETFSTVRLNLLNNQAHHRGILQFANNTNQGELSLNNKLISANPTNRHLKRTSSHPLSLQ